MSKISKGREDASSKGLQWAKPYIANVLCCALRDIYLIGLTQQMYIIVPTTLFTKWEEVMVVKATVLEA